MPSPNHATDDNDASSDPSPSPRRQRTPGQAPATPKRRKASAGQTPKSAPAGASGGAPAAAVAPGPAAAANRPRRLSQSQGVPPTLLTDFFLGRPSQARITAQRRKNGDAAAVKAELRTAMRQSSVQRLQPPGGVKDRVKAWQKSNAAAMAKGNPEATPSEPTDVAFATDEASVTEADRLRIRARQKAKMAKMAKSPPGKHEHAKTDGEDNGVRPWQQRKGNKAKTDPDADEDEADSESESEGERGHGPKHHTVKLPKQRKGLGDGVAAASPPKKRIVSDDNWMKRGNRASQRPRSPKAKSPAGGAPAPIPKDFLQRTTRNPTVQSKIKDWAKRVEPPGPPKPQQSSGRKTPKPPDDDGSGAESDATKRPAPTSWRSAPDDGIRVRPQRSTKSAGEGPSRQQQQQQQQQQQREAKAGVRPEKKQYDGDGIRIRPMRPDEPENEDHIHVSTSGDDTTMPSGKKVSSPSDGIDKNTASKQRPSAARKPVAQTPQQPRPKSPSQTTVRSAPTVSTRQEESSLGPAQSVTEDQESVLDTPTRRPRRRRSAETTVTATTVTATTVTATSATTATTRKPRRKRAPSPTETRSEEATTRISSEYSSSGSSGSLSSDADHDDDEASYADSYGPSTVPPKSLADIPVGYSAFSVLDLPGQGESGRGRGRDRATRNPSFKSVPHVLKKVVSEGKKMIHDKVDPPARPPVNQPPSIENWLSGTVDPFVEPKPARKVSSAQARKATETQWQKDVRRRSSSETRKRPEAASPTRAPKDVPRRAASQDRSATPLRSPGEAEKENQAVQTASTPEAAPAKLRRPSVTATAPGTQETPKPKVSPATGLKRSGATRGPSSPLKSGGSKKPFRELLRDAFRGESGVQKPPLSYPSYEMTGAARDRGRYQTTDSDVSYEDSVDDRKSRRRSSGASSKSDTITALTESVVTTSTVTETSDGSSSFVSSATSSTGLPRRRPPPTSGDHELSTIVSVESSVTRSSDTMSTISESTVTQGSTLARGADGRSDPSNQKAPGLKRRLTKHSDLVSVLSLPEDAQLPARTRSIRLARSLHRKTSKLDNATLDDLLREFSEDENIYRRELKTLVSGVIPVLLTQFVEKPSDSSTAEIFGADLSNRTVDAMSRAVVNMGVALEKLSLLHQFVPLTDAARMVQWLEKVSPVYDSYLDAWRLGFQGVIVNLAPAAGKSAEEDSLINGLERNEDGDVLDENGERVDVAYLLRRPLVRIKWMLKFAKGVSFILGRGVAGVAVDKLEALHEKARRRNREETARKTDEDANATDTTRVRDLRTLAVLDHVSVDQTRQVAAKDWFDLSLSHSNGQRLECQVELIFRDKISDASDRGDVLIRETGSGGRSWLLFPPISMLQISARRGQDRRTLVLMIRDASHGADWYELITVTSDHDDTATEWLDILGTSPVPPPTTARLSPSPGKVEEADVPVGERKFASVADKAPQHESSPEAPKTPSRYHRHQRAPSTPTARSSQGEYDKTHTRGASGSDLPSSIYPPRSDSLSHPLREDMRPEPAQLRTPTSRDDAPPPPPAHRTPITKPAPILSPPADVGLPAARIRRRTSSPLKHEYHPSDISSDSDSTSQSSGSESDSSSDELDEDDVPDTIPGISIKGSDLGATESVVSESSLTPSNSASQAGLPGLRASCPSEYTLQLMASISYWSNRNGMWKDLGEPFSAIVITPGLIEAYMPGTTGTSTRRGPEFSASSRVELEAGAPRPLIALDLTPLVMIRQSTLVDLEIRSPVRSFSKYHRLDANIFRFRTQSPAELVNLYTAVHQSRMNNAKFKALEEEARFRSFGQGHTSGDGGDDTSSHRRRAWFGRKNSYRASTRAPSQSQGSSSSISATSFLRKLTGGGNTAFNIHGSSVDRQSRAGSGSGSGSGGGGGGGSLYTSSGSSSTGAGGVSGIGGMGALSFSAPRSPSVSLAESSNRGIQALGSSNIKMRCHLQIAANKWEDHGNCLLTIARPPPGVRQELTIYHGLEKRVLVVSIPKKANEKPLVVVDVVVGSACFSRLAARGIVLNVWEEMRDEQNRVGTAPSTGAISGRVRKWCFQFSSAAVASWVFGLVASEVHIT